MFTLKIGIFFILVTLPTCEYSFKDGRLVIVGKLVEKE